MSRLLKRYKDELVKEVLTRVSPAAGGTAPAGGGSGFGSPGVTSFNGRTGVVAMTAADIPGHHLTHENGGSDQISVAGLSGLLSTPQTAAAHAPTHKSGGSDAIKLDELAAPTDVTTLNADATKHGLLPKLANTGTQFLRDDGTWQNPGASSFVMTTVECNLGAAPNARRSGHVQITGLAGLTPGKAVLARQAGGPYTGKGTRVDEAEMDQLSVVGKVLNATTIDLYWASQYRVRGNFRFDYVVSG